MFPAVAAITAVGIEGRPPLFDSFQVGGSVSAVQELWRKRFAVEAFR